MERSLQLSSFSTRMRLICRERFLSLPQLRYSLQLSSLSQPKVVCSCQAWVQLFVFSKQLDPRGEWAQIRPLQGQSYINNLQHFCPHYEVLEHKQVSPRSHIIAFISGKLLTFNILTTKLRASRCHVNILVFLLRHFN